VTIRRSFFVSNPTHRFLLARCVPQVTIFLDNAALFHFGVSLTHRAILEGFGALDPASDNEAVVAGEAMSLVWVDMTLLILEQTHAQLPVLLQVCVCVCVCVCVLQCVVVCCSVL